MILIHLINEHLVHKYFVRMSFGWTTKDINLNILLLFWVSNFILYIHIFLFSFCSFCISTFRLPNIFLIILVIMDFVILVSTKIHYNKFLNITVKNCEFESVSLYFFHCLISFSLSHLLFFIHFLKLPLCCSYYIKN